MAQPKRKKSKRKTRSRIMSHKRPLPTVGTCPNCDAPRQPHRVCAACGYYGDRQVLTISADD